MIRFFSLSLLFHALLLAPIYWMLSPPAGTEPSETPIQFSQGEVFVGNAPLPQSADQPPPASVTNSTSAAEAEQAAPTNGGAANLGAPDGEANLTEAIIASYPPLSTRLGEEGSVTIAFEISNEGILGNIRAIRGSGFSRLDMAALQAISRARYSPAILNGQPVSSRKEITIEFRLNEPVRILP